MTTRFNTLTAEQLAGALGSERPPVLVDVREPAAFEAGHIPASRNVYVYELGSRRSELPAGLATRLVVVSEHQKRAHAGATFLALIGFGDVSVLDGGIATWKGEIRTGPPEKKQPAGPELRVVPNEPAGDESTPES